MISISNGVAECHTHFMNVFHACHSRRYSDGLLEIHP